MSAARNLPRIEELFSVDVIQAIIDALLDESPQSVDGDQIPSIRQRELDLIAMARRFLRAYPRITDEEGERIATEVLHTCNRFAGGSGRVEAAREKMKAPVLAAGRLIDTTFGKIGEQLIVRPLTGPVAKRRIAPLTLAEQVSERLIVKKEMDDERIRKAAEAEAERLEREAKIAAELAAKGSSVVSAEDAAKAQADAQAQRETAAAPMNKLTRTSGNLAGSTSGRRVRVFEIVNAALVPRQYCVPSDALIREAAGKPDTPMPDIPGVAIRDVTDLNRR